jgi:RimJ/RimL family protein N-acetyltransferase
MDLRHVALASERLTLTAFTADDAAEIFDAVTPAVTRYMAFDPSPSRESFAAVWHDWLPKMAAGAELFMVVRRKSTGEFLGMAGLHRLELAEPEAGIWIKPAAHGRGYGREAVATLISWAARACGIQDVIYPVVEANHPSRRLAERLDGVIIGARTLRKSPERELPEVVYKIPAPRAP